MKARTARIHYLVVFALAFVGTAVFSAIVAISAVFPFAYTALTDFASKKFAGFNEKRKPAIEVAKAKKAELKKQQAKLNKDKKALEKKKKQLLAKQAKEIYEERVSAGYESSVNMMNAAYASDSAKPSKKSSKKKAADTFVFESTPIVAPEAVAEPVPDQVPVETSFDNEDYSSNGSMFRGLSF